GINRTRRPSPAGSNCACDSHMKNPAVAGLDLIRGSLDGRRVILHRFDFREWPTPGLFLGVRMHGPQTADIDRILLRFCREAVALEQPRGIWIGRSFENPVRSNDEWRAFDRINDVDRLP